MPAVSISPQPKLQFFDANGNPLAGGKLYSYDAGTTTPRATYTDSTGAIANANPVILDSRGEASVWLDFSPYKLALYTASNVLVWTVDGLNGPDQATIASVLATLAASNGSSLMGFVQAGSGAQARTAQAKMREIISVKDYGAVGNGSTDDRAAIAAAVVAARGKTLYFPAGQYRINTDGGSITLEEVTILGETVQDGASTVIDQGASFAIYGTTNSPFKVRRGVTFDGVGFYYPTQTDSATPTAFPVTLAFDFTNGAVQFVWIKNCVSFNAYRFIDINDAAGNVGHVWIENNTICALDRGIYIRHNLEHIRISGNNFTFGHWLPATEGGARTYVRANCTYIQIDQSDGIEIIDNLIFGALVGCKFAASGLTQFQTISVNKFDQCRYAIRATGSGTFDGIIEGNQLYCINPQNTSLQGIGVWVDTTGAGREKIVIDGNRFNLATEDHVKVSGDMPTRQIVVGPQSWDVWAAFKGSGTYGALNVSGANTNLVVTGGWFNGSDYSAYASGIIGSPNTLTVTGAAFNTCKNAIDITTNVYVATGNVSYSTVAATSDAVTATVIQSGLNYWDKPADKTTIRTPIAAFSNNASYANDAAAAAAGIPIGGFYRNGSVVQIRVS